MDGAAIHNATAPCMAALVAGGHATATTAGLAHGHDDGTAAWSQDAGELLDYRDELCGVEEF